MVFIDFYGFSGMLQTSFIHAKKDPKGKGEYWWLRVPAGQLRELPVLTGK